MIVHRVSQNTTEWLYLRAGIPTASSAHRVITPKTRKRSDQLDKYAMDLVAEKMLGRPLVTFKSKPMEDGSEREPQAVAAYEFSHSVETEPIGFITTDDGRFGCSPDRWIPDVRLVEAKCPQVQTHLAYMMGDGPDKDYFCQLQHQLFVSEMDRVDIVSFSAGLPDVVVAVQRDEEFIKLLTGYMEELYEIVQLRLHKLGQRGYFPRPKPEAQPDPFGITDEDVEYILAQAGQKD